MVGDIVGKIADFLSVILGELIPDKDLSKKLDAEIRMKLMDVVPNLIRDEMMAKRDVLLAEIGGESWMQRNWRPVLMLTIVAIVANNYLVAPYLGAMFGTGLQLELPGELWNLMTIGVGGYVAGRTGEKMVRFWRSGDE